VSINELPASPPPVTQGAPANQRRDVPPPSSWRARAGFLLACGLAGVAMGVVTGWLWDRLADVPRGLFFEGEIYYDESQLNVQSEVTMWFFAIGVILGIAVGLGAGLLGRRHGVVTVAAVLLLSLLATVVGAWCGIHWFGPDVEAAKAAASDGDELTGGLEIATWVAYLGWPIGGLAGLLVAIAAWPRERAYQFAANPPLPPDSAPS
jgi:hypothetical protein